MQAEQVVQVDNPSNVGNKKEGQSCNDEGMSSAGKSGWNFSWIRQQRSKAAPTFKRIGIEVPTSNRFSILESLEVESYSPSDHDAKEFIKDLCPKEKGPMRKTYKQQKIKEKSHLASFQQTNRLSVLPSSSPS